MENNQLKCSIHHIKQHNVWDFSTNPYLLAIFYFQIFVWNNYPLKANMKVNIVETETEG